MMRAYATVIYVLLAISGGCSPGSPQSREDVGRTAPVHDAGRTATGEEIQACPLGHTEFKVVSLPRDVVWLNDEVAEALAPELGLKYGPLGDEQVPVSKVVCVTCGFGYNENENHWSRSSRDAAEHTRPLSGLSESYIKHMAPSGEVYVYQEVRVDEVIHESIGFNADKDMLAVKERVLAFLKSHDATIEDGRGWGENGIQLWGEVEEVHYMSSLPAVFTESRIQFQWDSEERHRERVGSRVAR